MKKDSNESLTYREIEQFVTIRFKRHQLWGPSLILALRKVGIVKLEGRMIATISLLFETKRPVQIFCCCQRTIFHLLTFVA